LSWPTDVVGSSLDRVITYINFLFWFSVFYLILCSIAFAKKKLGKRKNG